MSNYYDAYNRPGVAYARVQLSASGDIGGQRAVFVDISGQKNDLVAPTFGATWANPFKGFAKIYAGDLFEFRTDEKGEHPEAYLLKTFKVKSQSTTTIKIYRDGYSHVPFVGDVLMKAPDTIGKKGGQASKVTSVVESTDGGKDVWEVVVDTEISDLTDGDILVEAQDSAQTATGTMLVKNISAVAPCDYDFVYYPMTGDYKEVSKVRVNITPMLHSTMYIHKMSPMPKCVLDLNKSRINGWYEV